MKKIAIAASAFALLAIPVAANAQAYVQVEAALDHLKLGKTDIDDGDSIGEYGNKATSFGYGVSAGYDVQLPHNLFVGVQASWDDSSAKACESYDEEGYYHEKDCNGGGRDVSAVVRLGAAVTPKTKVYAFGGYTNARIDRLYSYKDVYEGASDTNWTEDNYHTNLDGVRLGAGVQYDIAAKFFVKAEYRYSNYEHGVVRNQGVLAFGRSF